MAIKNTSSLFPVDLVYTWVNDQDSNWQSKKNKYLADNSTETSAIENDSIGEGRFKNSDELKYSLRSIAQYCPWVNNIYIVTDEQTPDWLNTGDEKIHVVDHKDIFPDASVLPTFNSLAIESCLHLIPNLSEHFIYFNDDFFVGSSLNVDFFFELNGQPRLFVTKDKHKFSPEKLLNSDPLKNVTIYHQVIMYARSLILKETNKLIRNEPAHIAKCFTKSQLMSYESKFEGVINQTRRNRTRQQTDIYLAALDSFYQQANGILGTQLKRLKTSSWLSNILGRQGQSYVHINLNAKLKKLDKTFVLISKLNPAMYCINDGKGTEQKARDKMVTFLEKQFPTKSQFEN